MPSPLMSTAALLERPEGLVLLDARPAAAYAEGHLPGALHADPERHLSRAGAEGHDPAKGGRHPLPELKAWLKQLGDWGIRPGVPVLVYDDQGGGNAAARAWWMLRSVGHEAAFVLDGGLQAAQEAGLELTQEVPEATPEEPYFARAWEWTTADLDIVEKLARSADWKVLDVRSAPRYRGEVEPLDPVAGHIPGALNLPFTENLEQGRFKSPEVLRELYEGFLDGTRPDHLVVHCGSGVTACHTLLALEHAGLPGAALYVGSWSEWCRSGKAQAQGAKP